MQFEDGKGSGYKARVDSTNRLHTRSISEPEEVHVSALGDTYNINTGSISFSAAGTMLYIKNNEDVVLVVKTIVVGLGAGTLSDSAVITISKNPTGGDLISDATAVSMNQNRNIGSSKTLSATVYKGKSAGTLTGQTDIGIIYATASSRAAVELNISIQKGGVFCVELDPNLSSGSINAYCAAICYLKDPNSLD